MDDHLNNALERFARGEKCLTLITGEGVAQGCGLAPFRDDPAPFEIEGTVYTTRELLTRRLFDERPDIVWRWHLARLEAARRAAPGPAHRTAVEMAQRLGSRFTLITECVDGLHRRAGHPDASLLEPHGNLFLMRCAGDCTPTRYPIPRALHDRTAASPLTDTLRRLLRCPACGGPARPHILWRDEICDEINYGMTRALEASRRTDLLIVAGFSGHTNLPNKIAWEVSQNHRAVIVDLNPEANPVAALARRTGGFALPLDPAEALPSMWNTVRAVLDDRSPAEHPHR